MNPNVTVGELVYQAVNLAKLKKLPMEAFALPTWTANHHILVPPASHEYPIEWFRFWISLGYKPRLIKLPALRATYESHHRIPEYFYVIEPNRKVSGGMKKRLLDLLKRPEVQGAIGVGKGVRWWYWSQFETLLSV